ncbi:MAG: anti-sigma factor antagonist [Eubacterium sp.]|nr:anti-sigma factor antagonist [Eubacterium sp.]
MNVTVETSGGLVIAYLNGEIDHHNSKEIREKIDTVITMNKPTHLILDFKNVSFMDSSGIGLIMGRYRLLQSYKSTLEVRGVNKQTKKIFELSGIGSIAIINTKEV